MVAPVEAADADRAGWVVPKPPGLAATASAPTAGEGSHT